MTVIAFRYIFDRLSRVRPLNPRVRGEEEGSGKRQDGASAGEHRLHEHAYSFTSYGHHSCMLLKLSEWIKVTSIDCLYTHARVESVRGTDVHKWTRW